MKRGPAGTIPGVNLRTPADQRLPDRASPPGADRRHQRRHAAPHGTIALRPRFQQQRDPVGVSDGSGAEKRRRSPAIHHIAGNFERNQPPGHGASGPGCRLMQRGPAAVRLGPRQRISRLFQRIEQCRIPSDTGNPPGALPGPGAETIVSIAHSDHLRHKIGTAAGERQPERIPVAVPPDIRPHIARQRPATAEIEQHVALLRRPTVGTDQGGKAPRDILFPLKEFPLQILKLFSLFAGKQIQQRNRILEFRKSGQPARRQNLLTGKRHQSGKLRVIERNSLPCCERPVVPKRGHFKAHPVQQKEIARIRREFRRLKPVEQPVAAPGDAGLQIAILPTVIPAPRPGKRKQFETEQRNPGINPAGIHRRTGQFRNRTQRTSAGGKKRFRHQPVRRKISGKAADQLTEDGDPFRRRTIGKPVRAEQTEKRFRPVRRKRQGSAPGLPGLLRRRHAPLPPLFQPPFAGGPAAGNRGGGGGRGTVGRDPSGDHRRQPRIAIDAGRGGKRGEILPGQPLLQPEQEPGAIGFRQHAVAVETHQIPAESLRIGAAPPSHRQSGDHPGGKRPGNRVQLRRDLLDHRRRRSRRNFPGSGHGKDAEQFIHRFRQRLFAGRRRSAPRLQRRMAVGEQTPERFRSSSGVFRQHRPLQPFEETDPTRLFPGRSFADCIEEAVKQAVARRKCAGAPGVADRLFHRFHGGGNRLLRPGLLRHRTELLAQCAGRGAHRAIEVRVAGIFHQPAAGQQETCPRAAHAGVSAARHQNGVSRILTRLMQCIDRGPVFRLPDQLPAQELLLRGKTLPRNIGFHGSGGEQPSGQNHDRQSRSKQYSHLQSFPFSLLQYHSNRIFQPAVKITKRLFFTVEQKPAMMWISPDFSIFGFPSITARPGLDQRTNASDGSTRPTGNASGKS